MASRRWECLRRTPVCSSTLNPSLAFNNIHYRKPELRIGWADRSSLIDNSEEVVGQHDQLIRLVRVIQVDVAMRMGIFIGAHGTCE